MAEILITTRDGGTFDDYDFINIPFSLLEDTEELAAKNIIFDKINKLVKKTNTQFDKDKKRWEY